MVPFQRWAVRLGAVATLVMPWTMAVSDGLASTTPEYVPVSVGDFGYWGDSCGLEYNFHVSAATALNNGGTVAGWSMYAGCDSSTKAAVTSSGILNPLPIESEPNFNNAWDSKAKGINDSGHVVGYSTLDGFGGLRAFLFDGASLVDLGSLCEDVCDLESARAWANDINATGEIVGASITADGRFHATKWVERTIYDLGVLPTYAHSDAVAINDDGVVVGTASDAARTRTQAFLHLAGSSRSLGTLGGTKSVASDVNNHGEVVGSAMTVAGSMHAFIYRDGIMTDIGTLGGSFSKALSINEWGQVVGFSAVSEDAAVHPFIYSDGVMRNLTELNSLGSGFALSGDAFTNTIETIAINEKAQIAATLDCNAGGGCGPDGVANAALATDVKAPSCKLISRAVHDRKEVLTVAVQDAGSGLASVAAQPVNGAAVKVPGFHVGTPRERHVTILQRNAAKHYLVTLHISDVGGNQAECRFSG